MGPVCLAGLGLLRGLRLLASGLGWFRDLGFRGLGVYLGYTVYGLECRCNFLRFGLFFARRHAGHACGTHKPSRRFVITELLLMAEQKIRVPHAGNNSSVHVAKCRRDKATPPAKDLAGKSCLRKLPSDEAPVLP